MRDPYEVLGLGRDATADQIRTAYRKLAKTSHPDLHPGDKAAEERFKEVSAANELLSDEEKRRQFDRGEIDASGAPRMREQSYRDFAESPGGARYAGAGSFENAADLEEMIQDLFGGRAGGRTMKMRGGDVGYRLEVGLGDVARGAKIPITLADRSSVEVTIPRGVESGQVLRLKGKGSPGHRRRPARRCADRDPRSAPIRPSSARVPTSTWHCRSPWARRSAAPRSPCRR